MMVSRPLSSSFPIFSSTSTSAQSHPSLNSYRAEAIGDANTGFPGNAQAGPSNSGTFSRPQGPSIASLLSLPKPKFTRAGNYATGGSNLNPDAPSRAKVPAKPRSSVVVEIPIGRRRKKPARELPPLVTQGDGLDVVVVPNRRQYKALQVDMMCPWHKCDAKLANVKIAAMHYARHQSTVASPLCGIRRCTHLLADSEPKTLRRHFADHHLVAHRPMPNYSDEDEIELGARARPPPARFLKPPPPLPTDDIPSYCVSSPRVLAFCPSSRRKSIIKDTVTVPELDGLPLDIREQKRRAISDSSLLMVPTAIHPIHQDYGDGPFWPTQGDAIAETSRYSSFIFSHPAPFTNNAIEMMQHREMAETMSNPSATSSMPVFTFPYLPSGSDSRSTSTSSSQTAVSLAVKPSSANSEPSSKSLRSPIPFQIVPRQYAGTLPMTVPLADLHAEAKREERQRVLANPRPAGPNIYDRKRKTFGPEAHHSDRLRRIAEKTASRMVGRTIGVDWWETVFEVERSLEDTVLGRDEEG